MLNSTDTIVAVATPPGRGGIGVVRVSGAEVPKIAQQVLNKLPKARYAELLDFHFKQQVIDQGIALYFKAPHSFTGEDVLELQAHGGPYVLDQIVQACLASGARMANPGEFSLRAFLNNKMDLTQVEAIADLINASSTQAAQSAVQSLQGEFSNKIQQLLTQLIKLRIYVEAAIDFPEEEVDFISDSHVAQDLEQLTEQINHIYQAAEQGVLLQEGVRVVIAGKPNAGKSSLLNALAQKQSAIVTDIAGTTRDVLHEEISIDGLPLHIIDTAGLRQSADVVEQEGIRRALNEIKSANLLLLVVDVTDPISIAEMPDNIRNAIAELPILQVNNKIDLLTESEINQNKDQLYISVKQNIGIDELRETLKQRAGYQQQTQGTFMARRRHLDALARTLTYLKQAKTQLSDAQAGELVAEELKQAQQRLAEITGEFSSDDLLGKIFSEFCIGK